MTQKEFTKRHKELFVGMIRLFLASSMGLRASVLNTQSLIELFITLQSHNSESQKMADINKLDLEQ
jgi:hypothetical protein